MNKYVGIVLVSHSEKIAQGVKDLIREVIKDVPIEVAGGELDGGIGTDIHRITTAIKKVFAQTNKGVLIFYDLGSAKMNSELAIELAGFNNVAIVEAPFVEGAYVGAVEALNKRGFEEIVLKIEATFSNQ